MKIGCSYHKLIFFPFILLPLLYKAPLKCGEWKRKKIEANNFMAQLNYNELEEIQIILTDAMR